MISYAIAGWKKLTFKSAQQMVRSLPIDLSCIRLKMRAFSSAGP